jgi:hypothetical protein
MENNKLSNYVTPPFPFIEFSYDQTFTLALFSVTCNQHLSYEWKTKFHNHQPLKPIWESGIYNRPYVSYTFISLLISPSVLPFSISTCPDICKVQWTITSWQCHTLIVNQCQFCTQVATWVVVIMDTCNMGDDTWAKTRQRRYMVSRNYCFTPCNKW